jgi:4-amino-4-deoxy-L-arabinose transferase-like glycosyltransferase
MDITDIHSPLSLTSRLRQHVSDKATLYTLCCIVTIGIVLRLLYMSQPMRYDESDTYVNFATLSFVDIFRSFASTNNHILHTLCVAIVTKLGGAAPEVIRIPAFVFGVVMIPLVYLLASEVYDTNAGLLAAALTAASSCLVEYSTNARGYTLLLDLTLVALIYAHQLRREDNRTVWLALGVVGALGFLTSPIMLYPFGTVALFLLLSILAGDVGYPRRQGLAHLALACGLGAVLTVLFYLPALLSSTIFNQPHLQPMAVQTLYARFLDPFFVSGYLWTRDMPPVVIGLFVVAFAASLAWHWKISRHKVPVVACVLLWVFLTTVFYHVVPLTRVLLFALPICIVSVASLLVLAGRRVRPGLAFTRGIGAVSVALTLLLSYNVLAHDTISSSSQTGIMRGAQGAARYIAANYHLTDGLVFAQNTYGEMQYYLFVNDVPFRLLTDKPAGTLWVVCNNNKEYAETLDATLAAKKIDAPYTVLDTRTFEMATVYKVALSRDHTQTAVAP